MPFTSLHQFLHMGGYAAYVWPAYAITFFVLIVNVIIPIVRKRKLSRHKKSC